MEFIDVLKEELDVLEDIMIGYRIQKRFPIIGGTALSVKKFDGMLNPTDEDIDLACMRQDEDELRNLLVPELLRCDFRIKHSWYNSNMELAQVTLVRNDQEKYGIDITICDNKDKWSWYTCYLGVGCDVEYVKRVPREHMEFLQKVKLEKCDFYAPKDLEGYLRVMYKTYDDLIPNFCFYNPEHSGSMVRQRKWKGYCKTDGTL